MKNVFTIVSSNSPPGPTPLSVFNAFLSVLYCSIKLKGKKPPKIYKTKFTMIFVYENHFKYIIFV